MEKNVSYKEAHELFVSGHDGTSLFEIAVLITCAPVSLLMTNSIVNCLPTCRSPLSRFAIDFCGQIIPALCTFTVLSDHVGTLILSMIIVTLSLLVFPHTPDLSTTTAPQSRPSLTSLFNSKLDVPQRQFVTSFRAYVNIASAVCILGVDFAIFPRRFCKAETYGTGMMDVGVGAFVIANAIVSPEARGTTSLHRSISEKLHSIIKSTKSTLPLLVLGIGRLVAVKGTNYHEHVSEYGVHWNFFFTLAVVKVLSSVLLCIVDARHSWILAAAVGTVYQYTLSCMGLNEFILFGSDGLGSRSGLLNANREGLFSSIGYLAIYFAGIQLGVYLFKLRASLKDWLRVLVVLFILDIIFWALIAMSQLYVDRVSRRIANLSYVLWMIAYNLQSLTSFLVVDLLQLAYQHYYLPHKPNDQQGHEIVRKIGLFNLLESVNRNGLFYFLFANILTGLVNMTMTTITASSTLALAVLVVYMFVLSAVTAVLHVYNISLKFW